MPQSRQPDRLAGSENSEESSHVGPTAKGGGEYDPSLAFAAVLEHSMSNLVVFDRSGTVLDASRSCGELMGLPMNRILHEPLSGVLGGEELQPNLDAVFAGEVSVSEAHVTSEPLAGEVWLRSKWVPLRDRGGEVTAGMLLAVDATAEKRANALAERLAYFDATTGLPNRAMLTIMLDRALTGAAARKRQLALVWLNIDRFKDVNDVLGVGAGDRLLCAVGERLSETVRSNDTVARVGSDDFLVLLYRMQSAGHLVRLVRRIQEVFSTPFILEGEAVYLTASIGIAIYPNGSGDARELQEHAHSAMRAAKRHGGGVCEVFSSNSSTMAQGGGDRIRLAGEIHDGVARDEFLLHFQPQIELASMRTVGVETLVRWRHPERGLVPPRDFIPFAEESGLIESLGDFVLRSACSQLHEWHSLHPARPRMAVNVSAREIHRTDMCSKVQQAAERAGIAPDHLEIEITESAVLKDPTRVRDVAACLHSIGATVALDDFGTGYSSLTHLRELPIDRVKIDRSFIAGCLSDPSAAAIVEAVADLSHRLGIEVVAEGVENAKQLMFVKTVGCDIVQGFHFAAPLTAEECSDHLRRGGHWGHTND